MPVALLEANDFRGARTEPATTPRLPRKLRRFHFEPSRMTDAPLLTLRFLLANDCRDAVDFDHRFSRQCRHRYRSSRRTAVREICFEYLIHGLIVGEVGKIDGELQNAIHSSAPSLDELLYVLHYLGGVGFDVILRHRAI